MKELSPSRVPYLYLHNTLKPFKYGERIYVEIVIKSPMYSTDCIKLLLNKYVEITDYYK